MLIQKFDPWRSELCTCPSKLSLNPYTGCSHSCVYCYASSYIPNFFKGRPKKDFIFRLSKEVKRLRGELITISNSSDPYQPLEERLLLTRRCLQVLSKCECRIQIVTKSSLVARDADLLGKLRACVAMTITTMNDELAGKLEPGAPPPSERMKALELLTERKIPVAVRIDPIIPFLNEEQEELVRKLAQIGVRHVTSSTYKVKHDNWQRFGSAFPGVARKLGQLYFVKGERFGRSFYLPKSLRSKLMRRMKELVERFGMRFGCCREGFPELNSAPCDGSWLLRG